MKLGYDVTIFVNNESTPYCMFSEETYEAATKLKEDLLAGKREDIVGQVTDVWIKKVEVKVGD